MYFVIKNMARGLKMRLIFGEICNPMREVIDILHFFSSVAHVWVPGAKTTGPIAKTFGFS
jgi:hypothetical protein